MKEKVVNTKTNSFVTIRKNIVHGIKAVIWTVGEPEPLEIRGLGKRTAVHHILMCLNGDGTIYRDPIRISQLTVRKMLTEAGKRGLIQFKTPVEKTLRDEGVLIVFSFVEMDSVPSRYRIPAGWLPVPA